MATHHEVAENWVKQTGKKCRGFNVFYDDNTIYSYGYHFPLAHLYDGFALVNSNRYSVSTSKHQTIVKWVLIDADVEFITVPSIGRHTLNLPYLANEMKEAIDRGKRRRYKSYARMDLKDAKNYPHRS